MTEPTPKSGKSAFVILAVAIAFGAFLAFGTAREVTPVYCDRDLKPGPKTVVMLTASWCRYCARARRLLVQRAVPYCEYDIERSQTGAARYAQAKIGAIPIIYIRDRVLVGFDRRELEAALAVQSADP